jgi:DMSO/TMAO reductase YedYZ molybdopterin-dependent catalytic subunit
VSEHTERERATDSAGTMEGITREEELRAQLEDAPTIGVDDFRKRSRRSFMTGAAGVAGAYAGWRWLNAQPDAGRIPAPLRSTLEANEAIWSGISQHRSAPEYPQSKATPIKVTGRVGIGNEIDLGDWTVRVEGPDGQQLDELDISYFEGLPQSDLIIEHKCIEGWSSIVQWGGARFTDFHERFADQVGGAPYVYMETPDGQYYVGWDTAAILHPQTMLALREGGEPLTQAHGAPLRIATPNKYGIKCIKRVGLIRYTNERPADYWAERSYDWYAGL